jgi:hypothetical protein
MTTVVPAGAMAAARPIVRSGRASVPGFESEPPFETYSIPSTGGAVVALGVGAGVEADRGEATEVPGTGDAWLASAVDVAPDVALADGDGCPIVAWVLGDASRMPPVEPGQRGEIMSHTGTSAANASVDPTMATRKAVARLTPEW